MRSSEAAASAFQYNLVLSYLFHHTKRIGRKTQEKPEKNAQGKTTGNLT
ncbi:hypothetical protein SCIP_0267 [Scardovia inopinata JCM 12537]|nr:hypothetical protein SCIP_0267 [Scardovia inopinata JCM 12537]